MTNQPTEALDAIEQALRYYSYEGNPSFPSHSNDEGKHARDAIDQLPILRRHVANVAACIAPSTTKELDSIEQALRIYSDPYNQIDEDGEELTVPDFYAEMGFERFAHQALTHITTLRQQVAELVAEREARLAKDAEDASYHGGG